MPYNVGMTAKEAKDIALGVETYRTFRNTALEKIHERIEEDAREGRFSSYLNVPIGNYVMGEVRKRIVHLVVALQDEGFRVETDPGSTSVNITVRWN